ncbi:hypothetical protein NE865_02767 [Phthorimaea operculella]|nr:hypothetical protein NE865_02767 [Phthorimaea operculella]
MEVDDPPVDPGGGGYVPNTKRGREGDSTSGGPAKKSHTAEISDSVQSTYTIPEFLDSRKIYGDQDVGPYVVHVSKSISEIDDNLKSGIVLRPIKFGHFLFNNKIQNIKKDGVKRIFRNRVSVEFTSADAANTFLSHPALAGAKYEAIIPSFNVTRMGIVRQVPAEWTLEELVTSIEVPQGFGKVIRARRLNKKVQKDGTNSWVPTQTVVVTFLGQKLPSHVYCFYTSLPVETYVLPTIQCHMCCRFGHVASQCRSKKRCFICAQEHSGYECPSSVPTCLFCSGSHKAIDPSCPEHMRQKKY